MHTVWLTDRDIELLAERDDAAVHCLLSNLRLGDGIARLPALRDAGVASRSARTAAAATRRSTCSS